jgi:hypothetical protein
MDGPANDQEGRLPDDDRSGTGNRPPYPAAAAGHGAAGPGYGFRNAGRRGFAGPQDVFAARPRRLSEFLMPAAVILAGVLIVVAFGFIVNRALRSDDDTSIPLTQAPPALGEVPSEPADKGVIPLPGPSAGGTPSASATSSKPPARKTTPPFTGSIKISEAGIAPLVDLSAEGSRDWVHWGEESTFSLERDKNGNFAILEGAPTAPRFRHALSEQRFSWQGGSPVDHSDGTPTGIRTCGKGNGFTLSAPATTSNRTLRLYVGVVSGRGRLEAKLSTGGGTSTARLQQRGGSLDTTVFTLTYRAPRDGTLKLNWITEESFSQDCGGVALEAATLR